MTKRKSLFFIGLFILALGFITINMASGYVLCDCGADSGGGIGVPYHWWPIGIKMILSILL